MQPISPLSSKTSGFEGEANLLAKHLANYFTYRTVSSFCSIPPLDKDRVRLLCTEKQFDPLFSNQGGIRVIIARNFLIPLLSYYLPSIIEDKLLDMGKAAEMNADFPVNFFNDTIQRIISFYDNVEAAGFEVSVTPGLNRPIDKAIEEALERIYEKRGKKEKDLVFQTTQKLLKEIVSKAVLEKTPYLLQWPVWTVIKTVELCLHFTVEPIIQMIRSEPSGTNKTPSDEFEKCLITPINILTCRFLRQLKHQLQKEATEHRPPPSLGIDLTLLKQYWRKELFVLKIGECTNQKQVEQVFHGSTRQSWSDWLLNNFGLDKLVKTLASIISSSWQIAKDPSWRKRELELLYQSMNGTFKQPSSLLHEPDYVQSAVDELIEVVFKNELDQVVRRSKVLTFFANGAQKIFGYDAKKTILKYGVPKVCDLAEEASKAFSDFWGKPYCLRFGLLHEQVLCRMIG
jgi:hypothetical protein